MMSVSATDLNNMTQDTQSINEMPAGEYKIEMVDDEVVSSTYDEDLKSTGSLEELENLIKNSNGNVKLNKDYSGYTSRIYLNGPLTVDGQGHILDCAENKVYLFKIGTGDVVLKDLTIKNSHNRGSVEQAGAIYIGSSAKLTLMNCNFDSNNAAYGGAIYSDGGSLSVINCSFTNNNAYSEKGGAIYSKGEISIINSSFISNKALVDGGAIYSESEDDVEIIGTQFISNEAWGAIITRCFGGAICTKGDVIVEDCDFSSNKAENYGGAIYSYKSVIVTDSSFTANSAKEGGAIYVNGPRTVVDNSVFNRNSATSGHGGAIYATEWLHIGNSTLEGNTARGKGGATYSKYIKFSNTVNFVRNSAHGHGGAVYTDRISDNVKDLIFESNYADDDYGGAIYINSKCGDVNIYNSVFNNNYAIAGDGGAVYSDSGSTNLKFYNCNFNGNYVNGGVEKRYGGAIRSSGNLMLSNCTFKGNWAQNSGGAVYCNSKLEVDGSYFESNNVYVDYGGAVYADKLDHVKDSVFISNFAQNSGGAVYVNSACTMAVSTTYFESNRANYRGGAIFTDSIDSHLRLTNNAFLSNNAVDQGKIVFSTGYYDIISSNWWGSSYPSFDNQNLMEYKRWGSNVKHGDSNPVKVSTYPFTFTPVNYLPVHFKVSFTSDVPQYLANKARFSTSSNGIFNLTSVEKNGFYFDYTPMTGGTHNVYVNNIEIGPMFNFIDVKKTTVFGEDIIKIYGSSRVYSAVFLDANDNYLPKGTAVKFNVDGTEWIGKVSDNGVAELPINLDVGLHHVTAYNLVTGDSFTNTIRVLTKVPVTYNRGDYYLVKVSSEDEDSGEVTFTVGDEEYTSDINNGYASLELDFEPGKYAITTNYKDYSITEKIIISNQYSQVISHLNGTTYGALLPIYNNETFAKVGNVSYSEIGEDTYRYILPSNKSFIMYNVTVSDSDELTDVLKKISKEDYQVDVTIINLEKNTYRISEKIWSDREWNYLIHLTHGRLFINGNGATIDDEYHNNFLFLLPGTEVSINDITLKRFKRCFVNYGNLYCANSSFVENDARFFDTVTKGTVVNNFNQATFDNCVFKDNRNSESWVSMDIGQNENAGGGVLYAHDDSITNFITCSFKSKYDNIIVPGTGMVVFYEDNLNTDFDKVNTLLSKVIEQNPLYMHSYNGHFSMNCTVSVRSTSSLYSGETETFTYPNVESLLNAHEDTKTFIWDNNAFDSDASAFVINLEGKNYEVTLDQFEDMIEEDYVWRTPLKDIDTVYVPIKDYAIIDVDSRPIVVNGNGAVVKLTGNHDRNDNHFAVVPKQSSLTLVNMTLSGFNSAILNYGKLYVINCTFEDNVYRHLTVDRDYGGAILNYGALYCFNTTFKNNRATLGAAYYGDGISSQAIFDNCIFKDNTYISALLWKTGKANTMDLTNNAVVKLINCEIDESTINTEEDALFFITDNDDAYATLNYVVDSVSALMKLSKLIKDNQEYDIINVTFVKGDYGVFPDSSKLFEFDYGKLILNGAGSHIFVENPKRSDETQFLITTSRSNVIINDLAIEGFNIAVENYGTLTVINTHFIKNCVDYLIHDDQGGAIINKGTLNVLNSTFEGNYAKYGGAIYNTGYALIINSTFRDNIGYDSKSNVDVYTHEANTNIIHISGALPKTIEHFSLTGLEEDLLKSSILIVTFAVVSATSYHFAKIETTWSHWVSTLVAAAIGGSFGAVHGAVYAKSYQDYRLFWVKVLEGIADGIGFVEYGEAMYDIPNIWKLDLAPGSMGDWSEVLDTILDELVSRGYDIFSSDMIDNHLTKPVSEVTTIFDLEGVI